MQRHGAIVHLQVLGVLEFLVHERLKAEIGVSVFVREVLVFSLGILFIVPRAVACEGGKGKRDGSMVMSGGECGLLCKSLLHRSHSPIHATYP